MCAAGEISLTDLSPGISRATAWQKENQSQSTGPAVQRSPAGEIMTAATHQTASTEFVEANGVRYAYPRIGSGGDAPLVMLQHFIGNLDNWDPALIDALA